MFDKLESTGGMDESARELSSGDYVKEVVNIKGTPYYSFSRNFEFRNVNELKAFLTEDETYYRKITADSKDASQYDKSSHTAPYSSITLDSGTFIGVLKDSILDESLEKDSKSGNASKSKETIDVSDTDLKGSKSIGEMYEKLGLVVEVSITLPSTITESNGKVQGNTATWSMNDLPDDGKLIAVTGNNPILSSDQTPPVIKGAKNGKRYRKNVTLRFSDKNGIRNVQINGKKKGTKKTVLKKNGKYIVKVTDKAGNTSTVRFWINK